ncbi:MAG: hypothetical protein HYV09_16975 [Deltaproteobacteria bacterium]|nr:hypothetical protein [Deltaproteobacteria bacterium]
MYIDLSSDELAEVRAAVDRTIQILDKELVRTDAPRLQHDLAADVERLRRIRDKLVPQAQSAHV